MKLPRTRKAAKKAGLPFYFTGKPCKHGHLSPRKVVNWTCHKCAKKSNMVWLKGKNKKRTGRVVIIWKGKAH